MTRSARLAWPDDAVALARIQRDAWAPHVEVEGGFGDADEHADRWIATLTRSPEARFRVLVATDDTDDVVGYCVLHPGADPDVNPVADAELGELVVEHTARGQGHGSRLVHAAVDTAVADRFTVLRTWVASTDDATRGLLVSAGWGPDGAHRELESTDGSRVKQVRLHTQIA